MVFVFEEGGQTAAAFAVVLIAGIGAVLAYAFEETRKVFVEGLQQQMAVIAHTEKSVADSFGRDIRIPVAETLVLLADIGLDILQLLVDALRFETFARGLVGLASQRVERTVSLQLNCDIVPLMVIRPMTGT